MKTKFIFSLATLTAVNVFHVQGQVPETAYALREHVYTLASDSLLGRKAGSPQAAAAASYIIRNFEDIGLYPAALGDDHERSYLQRFGDNCANVLGFIPGSDPQLREEYIVLGAHYDHLGYRVSRGGDTVIYRGADDNASGIAVLIETARQLKAREGELRRSVIFAAFDAEEEGLYGSAAMAGNMALDNVKLMLNIDMVGWLDRAGKLQIRGAGDLRNGKRAVESVAPPERLKIHTVHNGQGLLTGSDHDSFHRAGVPSLHITTGTLSPYHKPEDSAEKIDYEGMELITAYVTDLTAEVASRDEIAPAAGIGRKSGETRTVEFALAAGIGSSRLNFHPKGAVQGVAAFSWHAGGFVQYNFEDEFAFRAGVNYAHRTFRYPMENEAGELLVTDGYRKLVSPALTVPVNVLWKIAYHNAYYLYIGGGLYYSYIFDMRLEGSPTDYYRNQGGFSLDIGWNLKHVGVACTAYFPFMYTSPAKPKAGGVSTYFTVYYKF